MRFVRVSLLMVSVIVAVIPDASAGDESAAPADAVAEGQRVTLFADIGGGTPPFTYQWMKDDVPIAGATDSTLTFPRIQVGDTGSYTVEVSNESGTIMSTPEDVTVQATLQSRIANVSIATSSGENLIVGFALANRDGTGSTQVLARVAGPALGQFGLTGTLPDPVLTVLSGSNAVASNDNWGSDGFVALTAAAAGAFPFPPASRDSALALSLAPANYTARVTDAGGQKGLAVLELYDTAPGASAMRPRLVNISARGIVGAKLTLIAGFTIDGTAAVTVLLRGIGPALASFETGPLLDDPRILLFRNDTLIAANENWADAQPAAIAEAARTVGAFALPAKSLDAALLVSLLPGSYTLQVNGPNESLGLALVELYEVP